MRAERVTRQGRRAVIALLVIAAAVPTVLSAGNNEAVAVGGGPVILDGTDAGFHGTSSGGVPVGTWLYASKAYTALMASATAGDAGTIAVVGAADSTATSNNCGAMAHWASAHAGFTATYYDGAAAINAFFSDLDAGNVHPRLIHIVESGFCTNGLIAAEQTALTSNAPIIADFVNSGGGLFTQFSAYGWLTTLLPTATFTNLNGFSNPQLTAAGNTTLPGLTNTDIQVPWHGHFGGTFPGLSVLAAESGFNVIIGGTNVTLPSNVSVSASPNPALINTNSVVTASVLDGTSTPVVGETVDFTVTSGPNNGQTSSATTNGSGLATWTYSSTTTGTDVIEIETEVNGNPKTATTNLLWITVPGTPAAPTATEGDTTASVTFVAPSTGGSAITSYLVTSSPGGLTGTGSASPITVTGLTNGTSYTFTVRATNAGGNGGTSAASNAVVPYGVPAAPTITGVTSGTGKLTVAFTPNATNGRPITSYTATRTPGGQTISGSSSPLTFTGLNSATSYTIRVLATNLRGNGAQSSASVATFPNGLPQLAIPEPDPGQVGVPYAKTFTATGGTQPYSWSVTTGTVPHGLSLSSVGKLSGVPNMPGTYVFTVKVTDADGATATQELTIVIKPSALASRPIASTPSGEGYWVATEDGGVFSFGDAEFHGSAKNTRPNAPIVAIVSSPTGGGYWLVGNDGGVFAYGDAEFFGAPTNLPLAGAVDGIVATPDGKGYWLVAEDGGVFAYGSAEFYGSAVGYAHATIVALTATPDGHGYWLTSSTGEVFAFGNAQHYGGANGMTLGGPIGGIVATPTGEGYWLVGEDGGVFAFGNARFHGGATNLPLVAPIVGLTSTPDAGGYWLVGSDGGVFAYGTAEYHGGLTDTRNPVGR